MLKNSSETMVKPDFPTYLPALLVKELRQGMKGYGFVIFLAIFPFLMAIPFFLYLVPGLDMEKGVVNACFWVGVLVVFLGLNPIRAVNSVVNEKKTRSAELISLTGMSPAKVILQKWVSFMAQSLLLGVIILPFYFLRYFLGGVELLNDLALLLLILSLSSVFTALGLWVSGLPALYRIFYYLFVIQFFSSVGMLLAFADSWSSIPSIFRAHPVLSCSLLLFFGVVITTLFCRFFLNLGARWFSMPSDNLSYPLRKNLIWLFLVFVLMTLSLFFFPFNSGDWNGVVKVWYVAFIVIIVSICCIDIILPSIFLPVHVKNFREKKGLGRWLAPLFLPGWQSSILFFIALTFVGSLVMAGMACAAGRPDKAITTAFLLILPACDMIFLLTILQPVFKKTGGYSLFISVIVVSLFVAAINILLAIVHNVPGNELWKPMFSFLPMGNSIASVGGVANLWEAPTSQDIAYGRIFFLGRCFFISLSLGLYAICSAPFWKRYFQIRKKENVVSQEEAH